MYERVERHAWWLTLAGVIPFLWFTAECWLNSRIVGVDPVLAVRGYGAVILGFLSGMYWLRGLLISGNAGLSISLLTISIIPALLGWVALLCSPSIGVILLVAGFSGLLGSEWQFYRLELIPYWFWRLRIRITGLVVLLLMGCWLSV